MPEILRNPLFAASVAAVLSVGTTVGVRAFAVRRGYVAKPKTDRWQSARPRCWAVSRSSLQPWPPG